MLCTPGRSSENSVHTKETIVKGYPGYTIDLEVWHMQNIYYNCNLDLIGRLSRSCNFVDAVKYHPESLKPSSPPYTVMLCSPGNAGFSTLKCVSFVLNPEDQKRISIQKGDWVLGAVERYCNSSQPEIDLEVARVGEVLQVNYFWKTVICQ